MRDDRRPLSRRAFLAGTTGLWISVALPRPRTAAAAAASAAPSTLTTAEWRCVEAITMRILPTDDTPGAREAGCVNFIDKALAAEDADALPAYRAALSALDRDCRERFALPFAELGTEIQDAVLVELETGRIERWQADGAQPEAFFATIRMHTILGFLLDPRHGGNRDYVGWKTIGWPGPVHALGGADADQLAGRRRVVPIWERVTTTPHDPQED